MNSDSLLFSELMDPFILCCIGLFGFAASRLTPLIRSGLRRLDRLRDVFEEIVDVLETDGEADQVGRDACVRQFLFGELPVRRGSRMQDARVRVGDMRRDHADLQAAHEGLGCPSPAL